MKSGLVSRRAARRKFYRNWLKANDVVVPKSFALQSERLNWHRLNQLTLIEELSQAIAAHNEKASSDE